MSWIPLARLLDPTWDNRPVTLDGLDLRALQASAANLAGELRRRRWTRVAVVTDDAWRLAVALWGGWSAGAVVYLAGTLGSDSASRLGDQVDGWLGEGTTLPDALDPIGPWPEHAPVAGPLPSDQPCLIVWTSGSTGVPAAVPKSLDQLETEVLAQEAVFGARLGQACVLGTVSAQHLYGLLFRLLWPLCAGRPFDRAQCSFPEDLIARTGGVDRALWVTSPALLRRMGDGLAWASAAGRVVMVSSSGGPLPADTAAHVQARLGVRPTEIYGSSETGGVAWRDLDAWWRPLPGVDVSVNPEGCARVRSDFLPPGEVVDTADAITLVDGGFLLQGRQDRIAKIEEKRVSLVAVEAALTEHAWVSDAAVQLVPIAPSRLGAVVVLSPEGLRAFLEQGRKAVTDVLRVTVRSRVEPIAVPRRFRLRAEVPRNSQGKLDGPAIAAILAAPLPVMPTVAQVTRAADDQVTLRLVVEPDLACFQGHFPTLPILPGVVQIDWAARFAREHLGLDGRFAGMENVKFARMIRPGAVVELTLERDADGARLTFRYAAGQVEVSRGRLLLQPSDAPVT
jgi:acyl-CoA synthetase (AMP-forming)/AMP-acid ligase II/3-hydroxymyristoyl/3-hydroxydecanoyl-(acyl carrier protein) dehydratase